MPDPAARQVAVLAVWLVKAVRVVPPAKEARQGGGAEMAQVARSLGMEARPVEVLVEAPLVKVVRPEAVEAPLGKGARTEEVAEVLALAALDHSAPVNARRVGASIRASLAVPMQGARRPVSVAIKTTERASAVLR